MNKIIESRIKDFSKNDYMLNLNTAREITQEYILYSLSKTDFFQHAAFQGGTALRIIYGLPRFSEDLDFILKKSSPFVWRPYLEKITIDMMSEGFMIEASDKSNERNPVKKAFIKESSLCSIINISLGSAEMMGKPPQSFRIKAEIDSNPPQYSKFITKKIEFPVPHTISSQDLPSLFASKSHALLCRTYVKGRDWYDFEWYVSKKIEPNYKHLSAAIKQNGYWQNQKILVDRKWYVENLRKKIDTIDWVDVRGDTESFLNQQGISQISKWSKEYFQSKVDVFEKNCITLDKRHDYDFGRV